MRSKIFTRTLPIALAATAGFASTASALVLSWDYTVTSVFDTDATVFTAGNGTQVNSAELISWSDTDGDTSSIGIDNSPISGVVFTNGDAEQANSYFHDNNPIALAARDLSSASLLVTINLTAATPPSEVGADMDPGEELTFAINFIETPNDPASGICADGSSRADAANAAGCRDIFVIGLDSGVYPFEYNGQDYVLNLFETTDELTLLSDETCLAAGVTPGEFGCIGFLTAENARTVADFAISVTADVPEPAMLGLFGLGLLGLGAARRRKA